MFHSGEVQLYVIVGDNKRSFGVDLEEIEFSYRNEMHKRHNEEHE